MLLKLWHDLTDPAHWRAARTYWQSGDWGGLATQLHWLVLRQMPFKARLRINHQTVLPQPETWPADRPLVSVIIPCFNYGHFVREAVDSVLAQSMPDLEIILIDGGSTDGSADIVRQITHPKIRTFLRDGRHYLGDNRNFGIAQARGKYVCCLDADDMFAPDYLLRTVFYLEATNLDIVGTAKRFFGQINRAYHGPAQPVLADLQRINPVPVTAVYRRSLWEEIGPFHDFGQGADYIFEDWEFWLRAAMQGARIFLHNHEALFLHRVHGISMSRNDQVKPRRDHAKAITALHIDQLSPAAFARSRQARQTIYRRDNPLVNLLRHAPATPSSSLTPESRYYPAALRADYGRYARYYDFAHLPM